MNYCFHLSCSNMWLSVLRYFRNIVLAINSCRIIIILYLPSDGRVAQCTTKTIPRQYVTLMSHFNFFQT